MFHVSNNKTITIKTCFNNPWMCIKRLYVSNSDFDQMLSCLCWTGQCTKCLVFKLMPIIFNFMARWNFKNLTGKTKQIQLTTNVQMRAIVCNLPPGSVGAPLTAADRRVHCLLWTIFHSKLPCYISYIIYTIMKYYYNIQVTVDVYRQGFFVSVSKVSPRLQGFTLEF